MEEDEKRHKKTPSVSHVQRHGTDTSSQPSEGTNHADILWTSRFGNCERVHFHCLCLSVHGTLFQQPQQTNIASYSNLHFRKTDLPTVLRGNWKTNMAARRLFWKLEMIKVSIWAVLAETKRGGQATSLGCDHQWDVGNERKCRIKSSAWAGFVAQVNTLPEPSLVNQPIRNHRHKFYTDKQLEDTRHHHLLHRNTQLWLLSRGAPASMPGVASFPPQTLC